MIEQPSFLIYVFIIVIFIIGMAFIIGDKVK